MRKLKTNLVAGLGALTLMAGSASPAMARERDNNGIGTAEVIAGAVVLAGVVALLARGDDDDDRRYNDRYYDNNHRYNDRYNNDRRYNDRDRYNNRRSSHNSSRRLIEQCVYAAERAGSRFGRNPNVTRITDVTRYRKGHHVKGRIEFDSGNRWGRGRNTRTSFDCQVEKGRIVDLDIGR